MHRSTEPHRVLLGSSRPQAVTVTPRTKGYLETVGAMESDAGHDDEQPGRLETNWSTNRLVVQAKCEVQVMDD